MAKERWWSFLVLFGIVAALSLVSVDSYSACNANSNTTCCLCNSTDENCTQSSTCLEGFYKVQNQSIQSCSGPVVPKTQSTPPTTEPQSIINPNVTTNPAPSEASSQVPVTSHAPVTETLTTENPVDDEPTGFPDIVCVKCPPTCLGNCTGPNPTVCDNCKYEYNNICYEKCPPKTKESNITETSEGNSTLCVAVPDDDDDSLPWPIIGGAAGGGVVVIVVVVVIVIFVCRRRRGSDSPRDRQKAKSKSGRSAMSQIIEDRQDGNKPDRPPPVTPGTMGNTPAGGGGGQPTSRRANYTNIPDPGKNFGRKIEEQTDTVLRYTKDPTEKAKNTQTREEVESLEIYENAQMMRLQGKMDLSKESTENINRFIEEQEVGDLGEAPRPPQAGGVKTPTKKPQGKAGIIKRLSQRITRKGQGKKETKEQPEDTAGEDYVDMSNTEVQGPEEDYENLNMTPRKTAKNQSAAATGGAKPVKPTGTQSREKAAAAAATNRGKTATQSAVKQEVGGGDDDTELEDYENAPKKREKVEKEDEMEIYENTPAIAEQEVADTEGLLEDYENVEKVLADTDGMEDYEPVEIGAQVEESPYMNVQFKKQK